MVTRKRDGYAVQNACRPRYERVIVKMIEVTLTGEDEDRILPNIFGPFPRWLSGCCRVSAWTGLRS